MGKEKASNANYAKQTNVTNNLVANSASKRVIREKDYALGKALSSCGEKVNCVVEKEKIRVIRPIRDIRVRKLHVDKNKIDYQYNFAL